MNKKIQEDKKLKSKLSKTTTGNPKYRDIDQLDTIEDIQNLYTHEKTLSNYIMILLKLYLQLCTKQNREQDLKY